MLVQESHRRFARRVPSRAWLPQRPLNIQGLVAISRPSWTSQFHFREMRTWSPFLRRFERFSAMGQMNRWTKPCYVLREGKGPCHLQHQRKLNKTKWTQASKMKIKMGKFKTFVISILISPLQSKACLTFEIYSYMESTFKSSDSFSKLLAKAL